MLTREKHVELRQSYAARQGSPAFAQAIAFRHRLQVEDVRTHFEEWRKRDSSELTAEDQRVLDEGGSTMATLCEQHELTLCLELVELHEEAAKMAGETFLAHLHGAQPAPAGDAKPSKPKAKKDGDA